MVLRIEEGIMEPEGYRGGEGKGDGEAWSWGEDRSKHHKEVLQEQATAWYTDNSFWHLKWRCLRGQQLS